MYSVLDILGCLFQYKPDDSHGKSDHHSQTEAVLLREGGAVF